MSLPENFDQPNDEGTAASEGEQASPAAAPSVSDASLEAIAARVDEIVNKRISGLQSMIDKSVGKRIGPLTQSVEQLQSQYLTPEEREQQQTATAAKENEDLKAQLQLYRLRQDHPEAVDLIIGAMEATSLEDQINFFESKLGKKTVAQVEAVVEATVGGPPAPTSNKGDSVPNPGTSPKMGAESARFGGEMNAEMADAILRDAPRGSLSGDLG